MAIKITPIYNWRKWPRMLSVQVHIVILTTIITWAFMLPTSDSTERFICLTLFVLVVISLVCRFIAQPKLHEAEGDFLE